MVPLASKICTKSFVLFNGFFKKKNENFHFFLIYLFYFIVLFIFFIYFFLFFFFFFCHKNSFKLCKNQQVDTLDAGFHIVVMKH